VVEARKVLALGEVRYNELRLDQFRHWVAAHPTRFISLCLERTAAFWLPHQNVGLTFVESGRRRYYYVVYSMTFLSIIGLLVTARRDLKSAMICASWLCVFPTIYYVVQFEDRYRYPIMWLTFLLGAVPLTAVLKWPFDQLIRRSVREKTSEARIEKERERGNGDARHLLPLRAASRNHAERLRFWTSVASGRP
jgi:uncharacterized membrane protein